MQACSDGCSGWSAYRGGRMVIGKSRASCDELVQIWGHIQVPETIDRKIGQVIKDDVDEVLFHRFLYST